MEPFAEPCAYERTPGAAASPLPRAYRPRQPHKSVLHQVVREHLLTFLAEGVENSADGEGYPYYVEKELRGYIGCADPALGFARLRCRDCGYERLLPFSCKNRGICPSCTGRRMSDEAAYLVDMVLPRSRYRQWTFTFPFVIRRLMARDYKLITAILGIVIRALYAHQRRIARHLGHSAAKCASVTFVQRFGEALTFEAAEFLRRRWLSVPRSPSGFLGRGARRDAEPPIVGTDLLLRLPTDMLSAKTAMPSPCLTARGAPPRWPRRCTGRGRKDRMARRQPARPRRPRADPARSSAPRAILAPPGRPRDAAPAR